MRYVYLAAIVALSVSIPSVSNGQSAPFSITNYQLVSRQYVSSSLSSITYRAELVNPGPAAMAVTATAASPSPGISVVPGQRNLHFSAVPANGRVASSDTFTLLADNNSPFDPTDLHWSFTAPVANAGRGQTAGVSNTVTLDGSGSTNPSAAGTLTYSWEFTSRPPGSSARLDNETSAMPSFIVDVPGDYEIALTVSNGVETDSAAVKVSTANTPPVANAGPNQTVAVGAIVIHNGSGSSDVDGNALTYSWTLVTKPAGSTATLSGASSVSPKFVVDKPGMYVAQLIVNDGLADSAPSTVTITTQNTPPVANADHAQIVTTGALVQLNGSGSTDVDGNPLTYSWSLITLPAGSKTSLSNLTAVNPTFTADVPGTYVAQLIVNDGFVNSSPETVTITTNAMQAPAANAGPNQTVMHNSTVSLSGSGTDLQGLPLTYQLALIAKPAGSNAVLSNANSPNATFVADLPGTYVAQLIVNNGVLSSPPATVTITTTNTPPVAHAGRSQNVAVGANVQLDGSASYDADHDPLTHSWSFTSRPNGSAATLFSANGKAPMFVADAAGTYVVQLIVNDGYTSSIPSTVTITASASPAITLTPNRLHLGRDHGTLTVSLSAPAGEGGQEVNLAISDGDVAPVPARVIIPQGSTAANVRVPRGTKGGSATITASAMSFASATAEVVGSNTIVLPAAAVAPGQKVPFPVTLSSAPASSVFVTLSSSDTTKLTLSATTLVFAAGSTTPSSTPQLSGVAIGSATITASATNFTTVSETIQVAPNITFSPAALTVSGFIAKNLNLVLSSAAPAGGQMINLSSSNTSVATVPPTVTIAANTTSVSVPVTGIGFGTTTIDANALPTLLDTYAAVTVVSAGTVNVPVAAPVGNLQTVTFPISLSSTAPTGGVTVSLSSTDTTTLTISPATVTIAAGSTTPVTQPTITGVAVGSATINASAPGYASSSLLVPVNNVQISLPSGASVGLTASTAFPVTLATPAPTGGLTVTLSSSNTSTASVTSTVTVAAGATTPVTQPQVKGVNIGSANITATAPGYIAATQPVSVTAAVNFNPAAISVAATASTNVTLTLSAAAPTGGVTVNLTSNNTGVATVPATVTFAAGTTSTTFAVAGVAAGSTTITAGASPNIANATLTVTVTPPGSIGTPSGLSVALAQSVAFPITLSTPAPTGGVTVTLASSNTSIVSISPSSVQIGAGAVTPSTQPQVTGVNLGSANITASAPGYTPATQSVSGTATVSFSSSSMTVGLNSSQNLTLTLSAKAPAGGVTVNLSSGNTGIATVPSTATFAANATTALAPLTALGNLGSTVIQASAPGIANATANVTVAQLPSIILPANLTVALGKTASLPVSLQTAAPAGGVTVTLVSSNTSATVTPASVTIAAGQMTPTTQPNVTGVNFPAATISATATGYASSSVPVLVNTTASLSPTSATIIGTNTSTFTITLGAPVPAGGVTISLNSSNPAAAAVPATVTIASGTSATFAVTGVAPGTTTITASAFPNIGSVTANVTVNPPGTITLNPATPGLGQTAPFPISISPVAPTGGVTIALSSSNTSIAKMSVTTVTIPAGMSSPTTSPNITGVNLGSATITASATNYTAATQPAQVSATVTVTPLSLVVGNTANMTLKLSAAAPTGGITVNLGSSDTTVATVPATATFAAGQTTITVPVTAVAVGTATIDASNPTGIADTTGTVTVNPPGIISIPSTPTVGLKSSAQFPITLLTPAPTGGVTLTLSSSNTSMATVSPASITIPAGGTSPSVQPNVTGANIGSANITVSAPNYTTSTASVQVTGTLTSITPASPLIYGTATQTFTLTLSTTAPTGGITLNLTSSNTSVATVPATVTIPANANTVTFVATGVAAGQTTITAGLLPNIANISTSLTDANPGSITLNPLALGKGQPGSLGIFLTPAPPVNTTVTLTSSNTGIATVTASVTVPAGQNLPGTQPTVTGTNFGSATITASAFGYVTTSEAVPVGDTITFPSNTLTINGIGTQNLTLTVSAPAPAGGFVINLSSSNSSVATVPATVTIPQNSTSVNVPVTAPGLAFGTTTITASESPNIAATTATVTVQSAGPIQTVPVTVALGTPVPFNVSLPAPASSSVTITLSSANTSMATISPASVTIPSGSLSPTTQPKVTAMNLGSVNVTASAAGYTPAVQPVTAMAAVSYSPSSLTIIGGAGTGTFTLTLSGAAPTGGLTVNLSSSNTSIATVPATATFGVGQTTATFTVTGITAGAATITASNAAGIAATSANVTVTPPGTITLAPNVIAGLGQAQSLALTLSPAAPTGGATVTLSSSNTSIATVTATSTVAANGTTPAVQPKVTGVGYGTVTITASAPGYGTTTQTVQISDSVSFTPNTLTITGPSAGTLTLTLSAPAPAAGITVNLTSSNTSVATVPATATFTSGKTTVSIPVTGLNIGSTVIDASSSPNIADTTATVTVQTGGPIAMPAATSVALGGTVTYAIKIPVAAPTAGVTVTLTSSNPAISVPATFVIPAGATQASVAPKLTGVNIGSATITASAPGFTATTSAANTVTATVTLSSTLSITGPKTSNITATLTALAPTGGVTINVISSNTAVATVPSTVTFAANSNTTTIPVTATGAGAATITASLLPNIPNATSSVTVTNQGTIGIPSNVSVPLGQSIPYNVTLTSGAPTPGITVNLASSNSSAVSISPASVFIAAGATAPATQPQVTGVNIGSVTITASSPVYTTGSQTASVTATVTPSPTSLTINGLGSANLTLTLSVNAPSGGVTINLSSSNTAVATVPATATFTQGANTVVVPVTSMTVGTAVITASLLPSIPAVTANVTVLTLGTVNLGPAISVTAGQSGALALSLPVGAPAGGVTVQLASSNSSLATVTPSSVVIPQGQTTPTTQPQVNGISVGSVNITATAPGFTASAPVSAAVNDTISFPSGLTVIQLPAKATSFTQNITLTLAVPVPTPVILNLSSSSTNVATVPTTVTIPANATTVLVPVTGKSGTAGAVTIHANKNPNIPDVTASVFVKNPAVGTITIAPVAVGKGLEAQITINLSAPQATDTNVTIYTSDPTKALIAGRVADPGAASVVATVAAGLTSAGGIYVQGLASSGTVSIYTLTTNFVDANATVTLNPSGFVLSTGPSTIGTPSFVVFQGTTTSLTVSSAMLSSSLNFLAVQQVANGFAPTVNVTSSNTSLGTISTSPVTFAAGVSSQTTNFLAASTSSNSAASVTLNVSVPSGFSTPAQDTSLTATIDATGMTTTNATVGNGLETTAQVTLDGVAPVDTVVTIKSPSSSVLFSTTSTGTGSTQIQITIPQGFTHTPPFYVYGAANSGTVTYTASAPNFNQTTGVVTLQPAGFVMQGPLGLGSSSFPASIGSTQGITVIAAMLNSSLGYLAQQAVAGSGSVTVNLHSSNTAVGTITSPVVIAGGTSNSVATFTALSSGTSSLTMTTPAGFSTPSVDTQINASIAAASVQVTSGVTVGNQLAVQGTAILSQAPANNETVTLMVTSGNILLAVNPTDMGASSIQITIAAGSTTGNYYIYGLASSGTAGYSATASGYTSGSGTITLAPSGVVLAGPNGLGLIGFTASVGTPQTLTVYTGTLNPAQSNKFSVVEQLAGFVVNGVTATINDSDSTFTYATLSPNPVTIPAGASSATVTFTPIANSGQTPFFLQIATPTGFTTPGNDVSLQVSVSN